MFMCVCVCVFVHLCVFLNLLCSVLNLHVHMQEEHGESAREIMVS